MTCRFCGEQLLEERVEIGYTHCTKPGCIAMWRAERLERFRLDLIPKQGFAISPAAAVVNGRSSGR